MLTIRIGTILNVTSTTGLEVPPFPGEAVYHASKACQEAFTNVLRTELVNTDIKVLALRPGVVATSFHEQRCVSLLLSYDHCISYQGSLSIIFMIVNEVPLVANM